MIRRVMRARDMLLTLTAIAGLLGLQAQLRMPDAPQEGRTQTAAQAAYATLPLAFEPNLGLAEDSVDFLVHHGQAVTAFSSGGTTTSVGGKQVTMSLTGAAEQDFAGTDELPSKTNYFLGNDQSKWQSDIPNYGKLLAKDVYPGIDLAYYGTNSQLEHDFIVSPGADYKQIAFGFTGQDDLSLDKDGNLILKAGDDTLTLNAPVTYQTDTNSKHTIPSNFELRDGTVTVAVADTYDPAKPLVIDPVLSLVYSTYLGGNGDDQGAKIAVDGDGNVYVTGPTTSTNLPTAVPYQASIGGSTDAYVAKFDATGSTLLYSTYFGGSGADSARSIAVDAAGEAYVGGITASNDLPTASPYQGSYGGGASDGFVLKLNAAGSSPLFATYLGGSAEDVIYGIALDPSDNAYVTGYTFSTNFPTAAPLQASSAGSKDIIIAKFMGSGAISYATYLGGSGDDEASSVAVNAAGEAFIAGNVTSTNFPTASPYQASKSGGLYDAVVVKLNAAGSALVYSTYLGGTGAEVGRDIVVDAGSNVYIGGYTSSTNFPTKNPYQASYAGGSFDGFAAKFDAAGSLVYATYIGGSGTDVGTGIAVDGSGRAYVVGYTSSTNFPTNSPYQAGNAGGNDVFVARFNQVGTALDFSSYLGGTGADVGFGVAVDAADTAFLTGYTDSANFPTATPYQTSHAGSNDAFVARISFAVDLVARVNPTLTFTVGSTSCALGTLSTTQTQQCTYILSAATNGESGYAISYLPATTLTSGGNTIDALGSMTASTLNTEQFGINLAANTAAGSHTATDFGAAPSGGVGAAAANYATANSFKFAVAGDQVASSAGPSLATAYTVSTIANIGSTTEAGAYSATVTYTIVARY